MDLAPVPDTAPAAASKEVRVAHWRGQLHARRDVLRREFFEQSDPPRLLRGLARMTDEIVVNVWAEAGMPAAATLVAVGGYGRGQLFPHSDVDVLIVLPQD